MADEESTDKGGKSPLQANGAGRPKVRNDGVGTTSTHGRTESSSQGGAYPNPHQGTEETKGKADFHGGQSEAAYHGTGQLGEDEVEGQKNLNSASKDD
ncbi:hypothetical protein ABVV53_03300 [Novosphingobium sp. RD2P27]|uniref:Uncharacterized protein n=1 Tax=Novosphingobium kalidii TaxID=3230299 RepID=A0ABV2CY10_9SPHN